MSAKSTYLVRAEDSPADECDVVPSTSAAKAAARWRLSHPQAKACQVLVWRWNQDEFKDQPAFISHISQPVGDVNR